MDGKPPAAASQPSGMNGMIVTVPTNVAIDPSAPRMPSLLFQNPRNSSVPNVHSEPPKNKVAPRMPSSGYSQKISGPLLINGISRSTSYANHFWYPKKKKMMTI